MQLKEGVISTGLRPELLMGLMVANDVWRACGRPEGVMITSLRDGKHSYRSLHYSGCAADLRTSYFDENQKQKAASMLEDWLGNSPDYDVVVEKTHIHFEWQPKRRV